MKIKDISRRTFLKTTTTLSGSLFLTGSLFSSCNLLTKKKNFFLYVGTYTSGGSKGIYVNRYNKKTGEFTAFSEESGIQNPSFLAIHPNHKYLYSVSQINQAGEHPEGKIFAFAIQPENHGLVHLNEQLSGGEGPCHVNVERTGKWVLAANYSGGSIAVFPIGEDGRLGVATDVVQHHGSSVNPERQKEPHPHSIWLSPDNRFAFVPDLGLDKIFIYELDLRNGRLIPNQPAFVHTAPGAGPRHFTFHPGGKYAFAINELNSTITSFRYFAGTGSLQKIESVSTLPEGFSGENYCADIHTSADGRFVYGSNRGHESIVCFAFDEKHEKLSLFQHQPTGGSWPRNFVIDPMGNFLLVANKKSNDIFSFSIDKKSGRLTPTTFRVGIPAPVCLKFLPV